ncbi:MAG TPA: hypothetical protein VFV23_08885 [Verrucomicrobiae bacterium]|nr:hypothetical protein [Verrucomicrobiae bacterium]
MAKENLELRERLQQIRNALLKLHKTLVDSERATYEKTFGKIPSPNHFLRLLTNDPWFAWLHPVSLLIVSMDEALDEKEPLTGEKVEALAKESIVLLVASESGQDFSRHYFEALQRDPDVVFAHAEISRILNPRKS